MNKKLWIAMPFSMFAVVGLWILLGVLTKTWFDADGYWQPIASFVALPVAITTILLIPYFIIKSFGRLSVKEEGQK